MVLSKESRSAASPERASTVAVIYDVIFPSEQSKGQRFPHFAQLRLILT